MAVSFGFLLPLSIVLARNFKEYNPSVRASHIVCKPAAATRRSLLCHECWSTGAELVNVPQWFHIHRALNIIAFIAGEHSCASYLGPVLNRWRRLWLGGHARLHLHNPVGVADAHLH